MGLRVALLALLVLFVPYPALMLSLGLQRIEDLAPQIASGRGRVTSFTVNAQAWTAGQLDPFVFAVIELDEQRELYLFSNVLAPPETLRIGMPVQVRFERREDVWLPLFVPAATERGA